MVCRRRVEFSLEYSGSYGYYCKFVGKKRKGGSYGIRDFKVIFIRGVIYFMVMVGSYVAF